MLNKFNLLISCLFIFNLTGNGQPSGIDTIWKRVCFVSDTLNASPSEKLQLLLNIQSTFNQSALRPDSTFSFLLNTIAKQYADQGEFMKGLRYYRQSVSVISSNTNKPCINPDLLLVAYYRMNVIYDSLNSVSDELKCLDSCISISERRKIINKYSLAALYKKTEYLFDVGDYNSCISYATTCEKTGNQYALRNSNRERDIGRQYSSSSIIWNALCQVILKNYQVADSLLKWQLKESKRTGSLFNVASIYEQMAELWLANDDVTQALHYYNMALKLEKKEGHFINCKGILNNIGLSLYFEKLNNYDAALNYFRKALTYVNEDKAQMKLDAIETLNVLSNIGIVFAKKGLYDSSFKYFQRALDQIKPGINEVGLLHSEYDEFAKLKKIDYLIDLLIEKGTACFDQFKVTKKLSSIHEAVRIYKIADQLLDRIKAEQTDMLSKLFWRTDSRRLYERAIEACYVYQNTEDAFYFFEKSRAVLLNDQLTEQHWLGEEDIQRQTQIKKKILRLMSIADNLNKDSDQFKETQDELFNARRELEHLMELIKERDPLYYESFIDQQPVTLQDVYKKILPGHQGLVEIFSGDSAVFIFIVSQGKTDFRKLPKGEFDSLSHRYVSLISKKSLLNSHFNEFVEVSGKLYHLIFQNNHLPAGRILISPDGQYFPFESLVISNPGDPLKYFLMDYAVGYTYSVRYMMNSFIDRMDSKSKTFLGVAPVNYQSNLQLANLTESDLSLARIKTFFNSSDNLTHAQATRAGFMDQFSKYRIIQLYTHASASGKNGEPVIYFADSSLNLSELLSEDKPVTRLIVLSACESGIGELVKGEGVFGFNRGFAALGIPSSISNLWSVDDRSTYKLTEYFYKYLSENMPIDQAMQKAKIKFIEDSDMEWQLPFYWASAIFVGSDEPIELRKKMPWTEIGLIISMICMAGLTIYWYNYTKRKMVIKNMVP